MPHELSWEDKGLYMRVYGAVAAADMIDFVVQIAGDVRFDELRYTISDFLDVESYEVSEVDVGEATALDRAHQLTNPRICEAFVATNPAVVALVEVWCAAKPVPGRTGIFASVVEAREWIATQRRQQSGVFLPRPLTGK
jgi:hypothetical protein